MSVRSELLLYLIDDFVEREREVEQRDLVDISGSFATRGIGASSMHIVQRHKRRIQTVERILSERIRVELDQPLELEDESRWYEDVLTDLKGRLQAEFNRLRQALEADCRQFLGQPLSWEYVEQFGSDEMKFRDRSEREAKIVKGKRDLRRRTAKPTDTSISLNINKSTIASLNLGTVVGNLQANVSVLQDAGQKDLARALSALAEALTDSQTLNEEQKREGIEMVAALGDELAKPEAERKSSVAKLVAQRLGQVVRRASEVAGAYELLKVAVRSSIGIELP